VRDQRCGLQQQRRRHAAELVILRDSFHAAHRENALAWNAAVQSFLLRHGL
jgi:pimeloyl-ACP methyl ester carboxylesterase